MKLKNLFKYLPAFVFCGFIFTFMVLWILLPKDTFSEQEKRELADFPELNGDTVLSGAFQKDLDSYLSDHTPARNFFVGLNADYELASGRNGSEGIYLGSDGFLFPKPSKETKQLDKNAEYISEFADDSDIPVYMTLIPSSGYVNSDKLPLVHEDYRDGEMIDNFSSKLSDSIVFIDVKDAFEKDTGGDLYYRTDHHWTAKGAYKCYALLGEKMGYAPLSEDCFTKESVDGFYGTSYSKSGLWFIQPDHVELWSNKDQSSGSVTVEIKDGSDKKSSDSYFFREQLKNDDKYPVYLDGNHSLVRITNTGASSDKKLIVVKDSYAHSIVPFLSQNYSEIIMADLRYYKKDISLLAEEEEADAILILYSLDNLSQDNNISYLF